MFLFPIGVFQGHLLREAETIKANIAPAHRHTVVPLSCIAKLNNRATRVAPRVCPKSRAVPIIPLAPPLRWMGAEAMIVLLLGV